MIFSALLALCFGVFLVVGAASGLRANRRLRALESTITTLRRVVIDLENRKPGPSSGDAADDQQGTGAEAEDTDGAVVPGTAVGGSTEGGAGATQDSDQPDPDVTPKQPTFAPPHPSPLAESARGPLTRDALEQNITSKWFVWLGGIALSLSGIFMVKYSIEHGLLGPTTRIVLGLLMAVIFGSAGEWIRRKQPAAVAALKNQELIPAALSAAAVATAFGSIYAGYALYGLFSSTIAFVLLTMIAAVAVLLSMLHGPFVAALGLIGAYLVPVLVSTGSNSAVRLFLFLTVINAGGLTVVRYFGWRWLQNAVLAVAAGWALLWMGTHPGGSDATTLSLYMLALLVLVFLPAFRSGGDETGTAGFHKIFRFAGAAIVTLLFCILVFQADQNIPSLAGFTALALFLLVTAYRDPDFELLPVLASVAALVIVATWKLQEISTVVSAAPGGSKFVSIDPVSIRALSFAGLFFGGLFGIAGFAGLWRARRPGLWAAVSAAVPVLMFTIIFWRAFDLQINLKWAALGLVLAGLALSCAWPISRQRMKAGFDEALGAYAVAVVAAIALAAAMALRDAWLSVSFAAMVPAIAWINSRLAVSALRYTAGLVAVIVLARLALNPYIFDYGLEGWYGFNWILYGYGIPAVAFYGAARLFRRELDDWLVICLESAALLFFVLLLSFEIRHIVLGGRLDAGRYDFVEQCLHSVAWGCTALGLLRQYGKAKKVVPLWGYRILGTLAIGQVVLLQAFLFNPVWRSVDIGGLPIFNILLLGFLLPATLCLLASREARRQGESKIELVTGVLALCLIFIYVSLEMRHAFRGNYLDAGRMSDAELYGYSICWLIYAGVLLFLAVLKKAPAMRYGSLAIVLLAIGKVFLIDMSTLTGLYRAGSFLALGIVLIGIGYFYQRFVFGPLAQQTAAEPD